MPKHTQTIVFDHLYGRRVKFKMELFAKKKWIAENR